MFIVGKDIAKDKERRMVPVPFSEANGVLINSQKSNKRRLEIKVGIFYE